MADRTVTGMTELTTPVDADRLYIVDNSEAAVDASKKMTIATLRKLFPAWGSPSSAEISGGVLAVSGPGWLKADVEGGAAASDDLDQITGLALGDLAIVTAANDARSIVLKNGTYLKLQSDFTLNNAYDTMILLCIGSDTFIELARSNNGA